MPLDNINEVIRAAMSYERSRAEVASYNIAIANVAIAPGAPSPAMTVKSTADFAQQLGLPAAKARTSQADETRVALDPSHPMADANGMVHYPKVDAANEMVTLVSATRAYEANIRAYNSLHAMTQKAFEIGK